MEEQLARQILEKFAQDGYRTVWAILTPIIHMKIEKMEPTGKCKVCLVLAQEYFDSLVTTHMHELQRQLQAVINNFEADILHRCFRGSGQPRFMTFADFGWRVGLTRAHDRWRYGFVLVYEGDLNFETMIPHLVRVLQKYEVTRLEWAPVKSTFIGSFSDFVEMPPARRPRHE